MVQGLIDTVRAAAPNNIIVVPSNSWDQKTGDAASDPPTGGNLMFTAHIYASNWNSTFQTQVATAAAKVPVFVTEWGYNATDSASFGPGPADDPRRRRRQLDGLGDRQLLGAPHVQRRLDSRR